MAFTSKIKGRYILIAGTLVVFFTMISFFFFPTFAPDENQNNHRFIYQEWKVETLYKNGKPTDHIQDLVLKINQDGTAEWIRKNGVHKMNFKITADSRHFVLEDPQALENLETIFELTPEKIRFGKKNKYTNYEYVLVPAGK